MAGFNKMFVMLPVMFLARKIDGEDPNVVSLIRLAYGVIQVICVATVLFAYVKSQSVTESKIMYIPAPAQPFADPNAKKKYTEVAYNVHVASTARSLLGSTLFGICMTVGLHFYKGMVMGLAIQTIMAPFNLIENPIVKALLFGDGIRLNGKIFDEKEGRELTAEDEVVDKAGNVVVRPAITTKKDASLEEVMLDTWDEGAKADLGPLMDMIDKKNCNFQSSDSHWTPIMVVSGLGAKGSSSAIRALLDLGANPAMVDTEGWNALHWAGFHNSLDGARVLCNETQLLSVKDKEGLTPVEMARKEKNNEVADIYEKALSETKKDK